MTRPRPGEMELERPTSWDHGDRSEERPLQSVSPWSREPAAGQGGPDCAPSLCAPRPPQAPCRHARPSAPAHGPAGGPAAPGGAPARARAVGPAAPAAPAPSPVLRGPAATLSRVHEGKAPAPPTRGSLELSPPPSASPEPRLLLQLLAPSWAAGPAHSSRWTRRCPSRRRAPRSRSCGSFSIRTRASGVRMEPPARGPWPARRGASGWGGSHACLCLPDGRCL